METFTHAIKGILLCSLLSAITLLSVEPAIEDPQVYSSSRSGSILYALQSGDPTKAINIYKDLYKSTGHHDFELLQQMAYLLLEQGYRSRDPEVLVLTLFGAGISANEGLLYILETGLNTEVPQLQLISLNFLAGSQNDRADEAINRAMSSNFLPIRLEAAYHLAQKKYPTAYGQIEALMFKVDKQLWFVFPQLFAMLGDPCSVKMLRKLMNNPNEDVRIEAILNTAKYQRDDLLPTIRTLASQLSVGQQEACATALGMMKDEASIDRLKLLAESTSAHVRLSARIALYKLGRKDFKTSIEEAALCGDIFAITALGEFSGSEDLLTKLARSDHPLIRLNASLALLERQDPRCLYGLGDVLIRDARDLAFVKIVSQGKGLHAWKTIPSAQQNFKDNPYAYEMSISMRETTLAKTVDLPEKDFLTVAQALFDSQQNDLIPSLVKLLENLRTPEAIEMLKSQQQKIGAPLIRNYCNLALYRLHESDLYAVNLQKWVSQQQQSGIIQFRPLLPWEMRANESPYQLTATETSQLLIESIEALAQSQDDAGIEALLNAIQNGNKKNKYALAGLLMRAIQ